MWNSKGQYYLCYLYGVHRKEAITRRIPYSRHMHIAKRYDQIQVLGRLSNTEISWNERSIILSVSKCITGHEYSICVLQIDNRELIH